MSSHLGNSSPFRTLMHRNGKGNRSKEESAAITVRGGCSDASDVRAHF
jgi:hypothetical protein